MRSICSQAIGLFKAPVFYNVRTHEIINRISEMRGNRSKGSLTTMLTSMYDDAAQKEFSMQFYV